MTPRFTVSEFLDLTNQTLNYALSNAEIEGEVANFKISKGRWVFFDLKDEQGTINCFATVYQLRISLEDGMQVRVSGSPKLTNFGRFSFTVKTLIPIGEGSIKRAFELSRQKLEKEGLFSPARKRPLPPEIQKIGVISSVTAAGYKDFLKILAARWGGLDILTANCGVQGESALPGLLAALDYFNTETNVDIIAILRGGGSADDLAIFNNEELTRKVATSRIPIITGIGHEIDTVLVDLAADIRASTPSNAAELLSRDKQTELYRLQDKIISLQSYLQNYTDTLQETNQASLQNLTSTFLAKITEAKTTLKLRRQTLDNLNPETVLKRGYAILSGSQTIGSQIQITTHQNLITAKVENVTKR